MKKFLLSLAVFALGSNVMMAEDPIASITFTKGSTAYEKTSAYGSEWSSTDGMWKFKAFNNNNNGWDFIAAGWSTDATSPTVASGVVCPLPVSSIVFSIGDRFTAGAITSAKLFVADNADFTDAVESTLTLPTGKNTEWVVNVATPAANKYYKVQLEIPKQSKNGQALSLTKIALYQNKYASEDPQPVEYTKVNSIAEAKALASKTKVEINFPMTVAFVNYSNVFAYDAAGDFIQIYGSNSYENNSIIPAGWKGEYELYGDATPELKPESLPASTEKGNFVPKAVAAADITTALVNQVILIKNVVLAEASPSAKANFTGTADGISLSLRNNYTLPSVEAGTYDITVVVIIYQDAPSLYVTNFTPSAGSNVAEIEGVETGEAVYFNLQGVKVAEPTNGVYIMVKGNKATKVYINK